MAKKSKIAKNEQRKIVVARWATRRAELKETIRKPSSSDSERAQAQAASSDRGSEWSTVRNMKDPLREIRNRYYGAAGAAVNAWCTATPALAWPRPLSQAP